MGTATVRGPVSTRSSCPPPTCSASSTSAASVAPAFRQARGADPDWWERLPLITAATLVISGGPTSQVSPDALAEVAAVIKDATFAVVPDAGHRVHSNRPAEFSALALPFLVQ